MNSLYILPQFNYYESKWNISMILDTVGPQAYQHLDKESKAYTLTTWLINVHTHSANSKTNRKYLNAYFYLELSNFGKFDSIRWTHDTFDG